MRDMVITTMCAADQKLYFVARDSHMNFSVYRTELSFRKTTKVCDIVASTIDSILFHYGTLYVATAKFHFDNNGKRNNSGSVITICGDKITRRYDDSSYQNQLVDGINRINLVVLSCGYYFDGDSSATRCRLKIYSLTSGLYYYLDPVSSYPVDMHARSGRVVVAYSDGSLRIYSIKQG
jgi:hypothetical protein